MEIKNFAILKGEGVKIDNGHILIPAPKKVKKGEVEVNEERLPYEVRTDTSFANGTIELKFKAKDYDTGILLIFYSADNERILIGLSWKFDGFIIGKEVTQLVPIVKSGSLKNYSLAEEHYLKISIQGSLAKLYFDNVLICETTVPIKESVIQIRCNSNKELEIFDLRVQTIKPNIFVVMQFSKDYNELFEDVIKPITEQAGYECVRADEYYTTTPILTDIIDSIQNSTAIIAEITPDNPNVFYEIGYSHAINKPTILLCDKKRDKLPFDISGFRTLFYENTIAGKKKVEQSLKKYLENIK
jgi:hypothetical protein